MGNPVGHDGELAVGVVSPLHHEAGVLVGHRDSELLVFTYGAPHDDPAYTFDDAIRSTTGRASEHARDVTAASSPVAQ